MNNENLNGTNQKNYWRSLEELNNAPEVEALKGREFMDTPVQEGQSDESSSEYQSARREFMKLMGAGIALASTACAKRPKEKIIPYVNKPADVTPGVANWYASTVTEAGAPMGVLVKTREGRPIKFEGNPEHPLTKGGLSAQGQASVLNVYDPDRLQGPVKMSGKTSTASSWDELDAAIVTQLKAVKSKGGKIRILTGELTGSTEKLVEDTARSLGAKWVAYEPVSEEDTVRAQELSYGSRVLPRYRFEKAKMIVSFGADFLGTWGHSVEYTKAFSEGRKLDKGRMSRLVVFEPTMTLTGANADTRMNVAAGDQLKVALALANEVIIGGGARYAGDSDVTSILSGYTAAKVAQDTGVDAALIKSTAKELLASKGASIVLGGGHTARGNLGVALDVVANLINSALDNDGNTVDGSVNYSTVHSDSAAFLDLVAEMKAGHVDALIIAGSNPVYFGGALGFEAALAKVGTVITVSRYLDETAMASHFVAADHHELENWGDAHSSKAVWSIRQPTISPLYKTRAFEDSMIAWAKGVGGFSATTWYDYLKGQWNGILREHGSSWDNALKEGVVYSKSAVEGSGKARSFKTGSVRSAMSAVSALGSGMKLVLYTKAGVGDGRFANNAWLQELPDPVTKNTWDNYACVGHSYAKKMSLNEGDVVRIKADGISMELPVHIQPGQNSETVAVAVGYGRTKAGRVGNGVGVNAYPFLKAEKTNIAFNGHIVSVEKTGKVHKLACTQGHHSMEGREIIKETTFGEFKLNPASGNHKEEHLITLWPEHKYEGYRWAMAIDLSACTGCGACVIGCQSENNIPVVGYKDIMNGREMHWMRIDRYYSGNPENPEAAFQPMLCQHCENAPCETVCPVLATMHDDEGLNQQAYNRCVGTRYCANNCPYKVRRFNWFTYTDVPSPQHLQYNPDITVRTRGVMEKCNFCTQRIRDAKHRAKDLGTKVQDGDVKTACQQSCPADAIYFGDINDKNSRVSKFAKDPRGYRVLEEINVRPSVNYLTKVRNKPRSEAAKSEHSNHS